MDTVKLRILHLAAALLAAAVPAQAGTKAAVFDFELIDSSLDGEMLGTTAAEKARLAKLAPMTRELIARYGYDSLDIAAVRERALGSNLQSCGFCDAALAKELGAEVAVTGTVQKVSNLILNINLYFRNVADNRLVLVGSVDVRGNTDESWFRGIRYLVKNRLFKGKTPQ